MALRYTQARSNKASIALPLLIMAALYWLSSVPGISLPDDPAQYALFYWISPSLQNAMHVPAYACLAWAWHWALGAWLRSSTAQTISTCAIASTYGVFDEWHQSFVPGRYGSFTDVMLDIAGAVFGLWLASWVNRHAADLIKQQRGHQQKPEKC